MEHPTTPQNSSRRSRCIDCLPQNDFQSDESVISAIQSESSTLSLIQWLTGENENILDTDRDRSDHSNSSCTNRLHASVIILNAIRDACRDYLELSSYNDKPSKSEESVIKQHQQTIWEDSFPALSSAASTVTPTILFGRKKESERPNNGQVWDGKQPKPKQQTVNEPKVKKKIKPVTVSSLPTNNVSAWGSIQTTSNSAGEANIGSISSQHVDLKEQKSEFHRNGLNRNDTQILPQCCLVNVGSTSDENDCSKQKSSCVEENTTHNEADEKLLRLVNIYATILRHQLVPYLLLELHLLIRLVSISDSTGPIQPREVSKVPFSKVFCSQQSCRDFGTRTINAIEPIILNLGHTTLKMLLSLDSLRKQCPTLMSKMQQIVESNSISLSFESGEKALGANSNTPHLTLPFDYTRDSRHNYKTPDLNRQFKEREELRDAFLFQLRAFQDVRGRLMEEDVSSKIINNIKVESRKMLQSLSPPNVVWFVSFFCDLLLQIGLVPIGETDRDVLKQVSDQKRLQKLHKRFTARDSQTNKHSSSQKLNIDKKQTFKESDTSLTEPSFHGHQEFFALFITACDSYKFNTPLKCRISHLITEMAAVNDTKGLCHHLAKTIMVAKFLGLLVFSPNWTVGEESALTDDFAHNEMTSFDLKQQIEKAWVEYRLVTVIPWVVEFLKMMRDATSKNSQHYTDIFVLLWSIRSYCCTASLNSQSVLQTNMLMISLQLAGLFNDIVTLQKAWNLPVTTLPSRITVENSKIATHDSSSKSSLIPIDTLPCWFNKPFLLSTTPYFRDLFELVEHIQSSTTNSTKIGTSAAKKVKPHPISTGPLKDFVELSSWQRLSLPPTSPSMGSPWSNSKLLADPGNRSTIKDKLVDCFFHQHVGLQHICETTVDQILKNFESTLESRLAPIFKNATTYEDFFNRIPSMEANEYIELLQSLHSGANVKAREEMKAEFSRVIGGTLELLSPPNTQPKVREIASSLALQYASDRGDQIIRSFIREEKKKLLDEFVRKERKFRAGVPLRATNGGKKSDAVESPSPDFKCLVHMTNLLRNFDINDMKMLMLDQLDVAKESVINKLQTHFIGKDPPYVRDFVSEMLSLLKKCIGADQPMPFILWAVFKAAEVLCLFGKMGYVDSATCKDIELIIKDHTNLKKLMLDDTNNNTILDDSLVGKFLFQLVEGSIVAPSVLEDSLIKLHAADESQCLNKVVDSLLYNLAQNLGFDNWRYDGFVIMVRLQRRMT